MAIQGHSAFSKATALLEPHHKIVLCHIQLGVLYPSAEKQLVYSIAPVDKESLCMCVRACVCVLTISSAHPYDV